MWVLSKVLSDFFDLACRGVMLVVWLNVMLKRLYYQVSGTKAYNVWNSSIWLVEEVVRTICLIYEFKIRNDGFCLKIQLLSWDKMR
jgi:hypothetical protein